MCEALNRLMKDELDKREAQGIEQGIEQEQKDRIAMMLRNGK